METCVLTEHGLHHFFSDTLALKIWMNQHVRKVGDKMSIRDCVTNTNKPAIKPSGDKCV